MFDEQIYKQDDKVNIRITYARIKLSLQMSSAFHYYSQDFVAPKVVYSKEMILLEWPLYIAFTYYTYIVYYNNKIYLNAWW